MPKRAQKRSRGLWLFFIVLLCTGLSSAYAFGAETYDCSLCHGTVVSDFTVAPVDRAAVCSKCHFGQHWTATVQTPYGWFASEQSAYAGPGIIHANGVHINSDYRSKAPYSEYCERCHAPASCTACHENVKHGQHGGSAVEPVTMITTTGGFLSWPAPETFTCGNSSCHTPLPDVVKTRPDGSELCLNCHSFGKAGHGDVSALHASNYVDNMLFNCANCHKNNLVDEHLQRTDANGLPLTCATCHASADQAVVGAIRDGRTNCDACHGSVHPNPEGIHGSNYVANPQVNCSLCHKNDLVQEHSSRGLDCNSCHASTNPQVTGAIKAGNTSCDACHVSIHTSLGTAHVSIYVVNPAVECSSCHQNDLVKEHSNRGLDCNSCHSSTNPQVVAAISSGQTTCDACHGPVHPDLNAAHLSGYVANPTLNCSLCHQNDLIGEHSSRGLNCNSCHGSTNPQVVNAISTGNTSCDACHGPVHTNLDSLHQSSFVATQQVKCSSCHNSNLMTEHKNRGLDCNICHSSTNTQVIDAINSGKTGCDACHSSIHADLVQKHNSTNTTCGRRHGGSRNRSANLITIHRNCNLCHASTNRNVVNAINSGNTDCLACHGGHGSGGSRSGSWGWGC